jgi:hypothetical protein
MYYCSCRCLSSSSRKIITLYTDSWRSTSLYFFVLYLPLYDKSEGRYSAAWSKAWGHFKWACSFPVAEVWPKQKNHPNWRQRDARLLKFYASVRGRSKINFLYLGFLERLNKCNTSPRCAEQGKARPRSVLNQVNLQGSPGLRTLWIR